MGIAIAQGRAPRAARAETPTSSAAAPADSFVDSLAKLVPGEALAGYVAALQVPGVGDRRGHHLALLAVFTVLAPLLLWSSARRADDHPHWLQYVVRTAAFVLVGAGGDAVLLTWLDGLRFIPGVGAIVIVALAAVILAPPAAAPPPRR